MNIFEHKAKYPIYFTLIIVIFFWIVFYDSIIHENYRAFWIAYINTAIHEWWHMLFFSAYYFFGNMFLYVAWWTILQLLVPTLIMWVFIKQKDFFWVSIMFAILWINLFSVSRYAWDAIKLDNLLLLFLWKATGSDKVGHDWNYMLTETWLLYKTDEISFWIWVSAVICFIIFFLYSTILIINRFRDWEI